MRSEPAERRVLWIDAVANLDRTSSRSGLAQLMERAGEAGFTSVVIDVKPTSGEVLYASRVAPRLQEWEPGRRVPLGYDLLAEALEAARAVNLEAFVSLNVFVEGYEHAGAIRGAIREKPERATWEAVGYAPSSPHGTVDPRSARLDQLTAFADQPWAFVNPAIPEVREYELAVLEEVARSYPVSGVILDRARYAGLLADFSPVTRTLLEDRIGQPIRRWPEDVFTYVAADEPGALSTFDGRLALRPGPLLGPWLELRASIIRDFMSEARRRVKGNRPEALFGTYAGSWYPVYYEVGVNWADPDNTTALSNIQEPVRSYLSPSYAAAGYADLLDLFFSGNYYPDVHVGDAASDWQTVEGAAKLVSAVVGGRSTVYGSIYLDQYKDAPHRMQQAVSVCRRESDGVMVFDAVHLERFGWWRAVKEALA